MDADDAMRHAVEQAVAAERLEGWQPTSAHLADLAALARADLLFGEYLARYRRAYPADAGMPADPVYGRIFRRSRPYFIPGTTVLRNNFGVRTREELSDLEFVATAGRLVQWHCGLTSRDFPPGCLDACVLHGHVFGDVYAWAGSYRSTELRRGDVGFAWQSGVAQAMAGIEQTAQRIAADTARLDTALLAFEMACLYAEYNRIHPFREGNGRTGTLMLHTLAALCGHRLDLATVTRDEWYAASRDSMPFRREGQANHRPLLPVMLRALCA